MVGVDEPKRRIRRPFGDRHASHVGGDLVEIIMAKILGNAVRAGAVPELPERD